MLYKYTNSDFAFWNFLENFSQNIFDPCLVESTESVDMEGWLGRGARLLGRQPDVQAPARPLAQG